MEIGMGARGAHVHQSRRHLRRTSPCRKEHIATSELMLKFPFEVPEFSSHPLSCLSEVMQVARIVQLTSPPSKRHAKTKLRYFQTEKTRTNCARTPTPTRSTISSHNSPPRSQSTLCVQRSRVYIYYLRVSQPTSVTHSKCTPTCSIR